MELSQAKVKSLKKQVLQDHVDILTTDLGDPDRYFPRLRSAGLLDRHDCEKIRHEVTTKDKVSKFVDILSEGRQGKDGKTTFDVLVDVLKNEGIHASVARGLQRALARAEEEEVRMIGKYVCHCVSEITSKRVWSHFYTYCGFV